MTWRRLGLVVLAALAIAFRVIPSLPLVFPHPGEVRFYEADPAFHVRQTHQTVAQYPALSRWDRGSHYPTGERGMNQGAFDWSMATTAMLLGMGHPSDHLVDLVAAWTPVVLATIMVLLVYWTARRVAEPAVALLCSALLVVCPGSLATYSLLGFADHHILEVVLTVWTCGAIMRGWQGAGAGASRPAHESAFHGRGGTPRLPLLQPAFADAFPLALFQYTWPGAPLHIVVAGLAMLAMGTASILRGEPARPGIQYSIRYGTALAIWYFPLAWLYPDAVMWRQTVPMIGMGAVSIATLLPLTLWGVEQVRSTPRWRGGLVLGGLAALAIGLAMSQRGQWALGMLLDPRSVLVAEQQAASMGTWFHDYGLVGLAALYALPFLALDKRQPVTVWAILVFGAVWIGLWWRTYDFIYAPPPFVALLAGLWIAQYRVPRALAVALVGVQTVLSLMGFVAWPWPPAATTHSLMVMNDDWADAMTWLRTQTPPLPRLTGLGPWHHDPHPYPPGSYGVFAAWDDGEYVAGPGQRPCLWSEDETPEYARWLLTDSEADAWSTLAGWKGVRYLVLDSRMAREALGVEIQLADLPFQSFFQLGRRVSVGGKTLSLPEPSPRFDQTMLSRLYLDNGNGLSHFRLVYASPGQALLTWNALSVTASGAVMTVGRSVRLRDNPAAPALEALASQHSIQATPAGIVYGGRLEPAVKIFEAVPGARLTGVSSTDVHIETVHYQTEAPAGQYSVVVPIAGLYRINGTTTVSVSEEQIQEGATIEVGP